MPTDVHMHSKTRVAQSVILANNQINRNPSRNTLGKRTKQTGKDSRGLSINGRT
jgi:hypothetical protein